MPYWQLPERLYDEPDEFREWALKAFAVARQGPKAKAKQSAKKPEPAPGKDATAGRKGAKPPRQKAPAKRPPRKSPAGKQN
jgi:DNA transformation protein